MANRDELLLGCRQWMQAALEELTLCPTAHTRPSLREGDELLKRIDAALRSGIALAPNERRLHELEAALVAVGAAFSSLDALVGAAKAIEEGRRVK